MACSNNIVHQWGLIEATQFAGFNIFTYPVEFVTYPLSALVCERGGRSWLDVPGYFSVHSIDSGYFYNNCVYTVSLDNSQGTINYNHNSGFCFVLGK